MYEQLSFDNHISTEEAHQLIDDAIERHHAAIVALKTQRNTFAPICRLPPEILCNIFIAVKTYYVANAGRIFSWGKYRSSLPWVKVTHVSRHWRNIAIASPTLWAFIDNSLLSNPPWLEKTLSRSQEAHLAIKAEVDLLRGPVVGLKLALEYIQRIKHLSISADTREWQEIQDVFKKSAPQLECLSLSGPFGEPSESIPGPIFCPEEIFCEIPKLRQLTLTGFEVNWKTSLFVKPRTLTYLKLHELSLNCRPTWKQLGDALNGLPNLEVLDLKKALPVHAGEQVPWDFGSVCLPSLQTLLIDFTILDEKEVKTLFSCITFPSNTSVRIKYLTRSTSGLQNYLPDFFLRLAPLFSSTHSDMSPQTLILYQDYFSIPEIRLKLYVCGLTDEQILAHKRIPPRLELALRWITASFSANMEDVATITNTIFDSVLPLQNVSRVCLTGMSTESDPAALANTVGKLPQVHFIMAAKRAQRNLIDALQLGLDVESADSDKALFFPNLSSIYFYGKGLWEDERHDQRHTFSVQELYDCLVQRSATGMEIEKVTFKAYPLKLERDDVGLLRSIVHEVDSDHENFFI